MSLGKRCQNNSLMKKVINIINKRGRYCQDCSRYVALMDHYLILIFFYFSAIDDAQ